MRYFILFTLLFFSNAYGDGLANSIAACNSLRSDDVACEMKVTPEGIPIFVFRATLIDTDIAAEIMTEVMWEACYEQQVGVILKSFNGTIYNLCRPDTGLADWKRAE